MLRTNLHEWVSHAPTSGPSHIAYRWRACTAHQPARVSLPWVDRPHAPAILQTGGVRVLRTNLHESDIDAKMRERLADRLFDLIPVGVGEAGAVK